MSQLDKRLEQMEATERGRLIAELDALFEGMTTEELAAHVDFQQRTCPIRELKNMIVELKQWLATHRPSMQGSTSEWQL